MMNLIKNNPVIVGGALIGLGALAWLTLRGAKGMGADIGGGAINLGVGVVSGAARAVKDNALDPSVNPFYDVGTGLGGWLFDITHPKP
jgi:hypothetical protein